jgi:GDPmannose 4,6-dehydratase
MSRKTAFITGITGQDGALLARFLLEKNYVVHGMRPYVATEDKERLHGFVLGHPDFSLHYGDLTDSGNLLHLLQSTQPDEIYNLGAQSHVAVSFALPEQTADVNALGTLRLLEAVCLSGLREKVRFYQASSSEMFGNIMPPQNEATPFAPCSPYAASKLYAYWITRIYRQAHGLFACNGILFNHESPLRGEEFVTRKIARAVARGEMLTLGNLDSRRDWGHAEDYVRGMWMMMQHETPDDFVLATGVARSVREFVSAAFAYVKTDLIWQGQGIEEQGICAKTEKILVRVDSALMRPNDVHCLIGDAAKAHSVLGWKPEISFEEMVAGMIDAERGGQVERLAAE